MAIGTDTHASFLGHFVHLFCADLNFKRCPIFRDDGGVQGLVKIRPRHGNEIFNPARHGAPKIVNDAEDGIAILQRSSDDPHGAQVVNLVDRDTLFLKLLVNAEQPLDTAFHPGLNPSLFQLVADELVGLFEKRFSLFASRIDCLLDLLVSHWVEETESQVFKFSADLAHAEPVRDGRIDFERLLSDLVLPLGIEMLQRAHVVQAVGQFDQDDPNVIHHGQHHLAVVFGLLLFPGGELDLADLGHALDNMGDLFAELLADIEDRDRSVLD